jgi:hypothetical protein
MPDLTRFLRLRSALLAALPLLAMLATPTTQPIESLLTADVIRRTDTPVKASVLPAILRSRLAEAEASRRPDPVEVDWRLLAGLDYESGEMSDDLKAVVGNEAKVPGFMVPLEDYLERVTEFLLVPYVGACVHTPPPPPNQLVYVKLPKGERAKVEWWDPIWVEGVLTIDQTENIYGSVSYTIDGARVTSYSN